MKKYIRDMTTEELEKVWNSNSKLREIVWNDALYYVDDFNIGEYLSDLDFRAAEYRIEYSGQWMYVKNENLFLQWVKKANYDFELFWDLEKDFPGRVEMLAEKGIMLYDKLESWPLSDENADRMQKRLDGICEMFVDEFLRICRAEYDWIDDDEKLFDFWADENQLCNWYDCFVDDDLTPGVLRRVEMITTVFA